MKANCVKQSINNIAGRILKTTLVLLFFLSTLCTSAQDQTEEKQYSANFNGQIVGWTTLNLEQPLKWQLGGRFIPKLEAEYKFTKLSKLDIEVSANSFAATSFSDFENTDSQADISPYRAWVRYSTPRLELRLGLQKINFGSATILRSLMWFDQIDPRDPLNLTNGVWSMLGRYYFSNNANLWLWALVANGEKKGWETVSSYTNKPEFGGRFQFPIGIGEAAFSYHHRTPNYDELDLLLTPPLLNKPEDRFAFDTKVDVSVGLWTEIEATATHQNKDQALISPWISKSVIGADYTFGIGNGLAVTKEFLFVNASNSLFEAGMYGSFSALSANYPIGLSDNISGMLYYGWQGSDWYRFISYNHSSDNWTFYFMAFWNPETLAISPNSEGSLFVGKGIQFMATFDF